MAELTTHDLNLLMLLGGLFCVAGILFCGALLAERWKTHHHSTQP